MDDKDDEYDFKDGERYSLTLALKLNKMVHDLCKDVPHDIGIKLSKEATNNFLFKWIPLSYGESCSLIRSWRILKSVLKKSNSMRINPLAFQLLEPIDAIIGVVEIRTKRQERIKAILPDSARGSE